MKKLKKFSTDQMRALTRKEMKQIVAGYQCTWFCIGWGFVTINGFPSCDAAGCPNDAKPADCGCSN